MSDIAKHDASLTDSHSPQMIANKMRQSGIAKANHPTMKLFVLAIMAGAFIALGALFYTLVVADSAFGAGQPECLAGWRFLSGWFWW